MLAIAVIFSLVSQAASTGCTSQVKQFESQCNTIKDASACEVQIACQWLSCFGREALYDDQCNSITEEAKCTDQIACSWGRPLLPHCFATLKDPSLMSKCAAANTTEACGGIIGCSWRLVDSTDQWLSAMHAQGRQYARQALPASVKFEKIDFTGSVQDFTVVPVAEFPTITKAWITKYNLLAGLSSADASDLSAIFSMSQYLLPVSPDYGLANTWNRPTFVYSAKDGGIVTNWYVIIAGRVWNGIASAAFIFMKTTATFTDSGKSMTEQELATVQDHLWDVMVQRMTNTELVLLRENMIQPRRSGVDAKMLLHNASDMLAKFVL